MKFRYVLGLCLHLTLLAVCLTTVIVMTMIKSFISANRASVLSTSTVDINGFQLIPDIGVGLHALVLALGMFIPSLTGLFYTCISHGKKEHSKSFRKNLRIAHIVFLTIGVIATSVLFFSHAGYVSDSVNCHMASYCICNGVNSVSNNVCAVRDLRHAYFSFLTINMAGLVVGILFASRLVRIPDHCCARVSQEPGNDTQGS